MASVMTRAPDTIASMSRYWSSHPSRIDNTIILLRNIRWMYSVLTIPRRASSPFDPATPIQHDNNDGADAGADDRVVPWLVVIIVGLVPLLLLLLVLCGFRVD
eukprot:CAMPEP_0170942750 /NCGR_PEP_ID=MMETSP0735-20130129/24423_1 /TAXON_ID=186038 /ORGANISM="Fragilariopsis kerguelensis, Strain L26-C5" /LENGTH=102 /DNA_ID=CAMNT_0011349797 /DNA_START=269 /DNA_END=574 /DNA_ORIENTATION=-